MKTNRFPLIIAILLTITLHVAELSQSSADERKSTEKQQTNTASDKKDVSSSIIQIKKQTLTGKVEVKGTFYPAIMDEIVIRPEVWTAFKIEKIISHGSQVKKGDVLIQFDAQDIDEKIAELKVSLEAKNLAFRQAVEEYKVAEELYPMELETAEKNLAYLKEDREYTKKISYPLQEETLEFRKKSAENTVAYAEEELKQLLKMYKEDGLTEETEEIVLKRTKDGYEQSLFSKKLSDENYSQNKTVSIPRQRLKDENEYVQKELELTKAVKIMPLKMAQKKLDMFKMEKDGKETQELLQKHVKDRELFTITAPVDGYVYYGEILDGALVNASTYAKLFVRDGTPPLKKTALTIFNNSDLLVHADLEESEINLVKEAQAVGISPKVEGERKLTGKIHVVKRFPDVNNKFTVKVKLDDKQNFTNIYPGMTAECSILQTELKDVIALPKSAVHEAEDKTQYVYLKTGEKFEKQAVKTGEMINKMLVITEGLKEGDQVSPEKPDSK